MVLSFENKTPSTEANDSFPSSTSTCFKLVVSLNRLLPNVLTDFGNVSFSKFDKLAKASCDINSNFELEEKVNFFNFWLKENALVPIYSRDAGNSISSNSEKSKALSSIFSSWLPLSKIIVLALLPWKPFFCIFFMLDGIVIELG